MPSARSALITFALLSCGTLIATAQNPSVPSGPPSLRSVPPLTVAVLKRDLTRIRRLLDGGADPTEKDAQGFSPWMWAINFQENDALTLLLDKVPTISAC